MRPRHVPDDALRATDVPAADGPLDELLAFGRSYHAYRVAGSLPRVGAIAVAVHDAWVADHDAAVDAVLDEPLSRLRVALFHTVRATDHGAVDDATAAWVRVIVRSVAARLTDDGRR